MDAPQTLAFLRYVHTLKHTPRTGWVRTGVPEPESIADHMYRTALMALLYAPPDVDRNRAVAMALCHDLAEAIAGDITPFDGVTPTDKHAREKVPPP